jgi:hypothetical protein
MRFTTVLPLPFLLPIRDGISVVGSFVRSSGLLAFKITFSREDGRIVRANEPQEPHPYTVLAVEYVRDSADSVGRVTEDLLRGVFLDTLAYVNYFLDAFRARYELHYIYNITVRDLPLAIRMHVDNDYYMYVCNPDKVIGYSREIDSRELAEVTMVRSYAVALRSVRLTA